MVRVQLVKDGMVMSAGGQQTLNMSSRAGLTSLDLAMPLKFRVASVGTGNAVRGKYILRVSPTYLI